MEIFLLHPHDIECNLANREPTRMRRVCVHFRGRERPSPTRVNLSLHLIEGQGCFPMLGSVQSQHWAVFNLNLLSAATAQCCFAGGEPDTTVKLEQTGTFQGH